MKPTAIHEALRPIAFLLGSWAGEGRGIYPTIEDFRYREEVRFWHTGKPFLAYAQRTWSLEDDTPMHAESGYWRPQADGRLEVVLAHPFGAVEVDRGEIMGTAIELQSSTVVTTPSAKRIDGVTRRLRVTGDELAYTFEMAAEGQPLQLHLEATLRRGGDGAAPS